MQKKTLQGKVWRIGCLQGDKGCTFKNECAYIHTDVHVTKKQAQVEIKNKAEYLELQVNEMANK